MAAALAILVQAAVIASVIVKEQGSPSGPELASAPNEGSYVLMRFAPQATANDITNFLGAYKAKVVDGPLNMGSPSASVNTTSTPVVTAKSCLLIFGRTSEQVIRGEVS
jgi:hypothetical protein